MLIYIYRFPNRAKSPERYAIWVRESRRDKEPSQFSVLCNIHFDERWIDRTGQTVRLRVGAVPEKFALPQHLQVRVLKLQEFRLNKCYIKKW